MERSVGVVHCGTERQSEEADGDGNREFAGPSPHAPPVGRIRFGGFASSGIAGDVEGLLAKRGWTSPTKRCGDGS